MGVIQIDPLKHGFEIEFESGPYENWTMCKI